jgi:(p)ppGpp synthase/HD superfamily hydrolase
LHDAAEDQGGAIILARIKKDFGEKVAEIVEFCSESIEIPKPERKTRKENYIIGFITLLPQQY